MAEDIQKLVDEQFSTLPKVVQDAITSGHIAEKFQALAPKYKMHLDEWQRIENLIMMTVLGLSKPEDPDDRIAEATKLDKDQVKTIVDDIATTIFLPIREELERGLGHPMAKEEEETDVEKVRQGVLAGERASAQAAAQPSVAPGTPPSPPPEEKASRGPASGAYKPGEASSERKSIQDDPYRETVD